MKTTPMNEKLYNYVMEHNFSIHPVLKKDYEIEIRKGLSILLFDVFEVSMCNDIARLAICQGDKVIFASKIRYPMLEGSIVVGHRFVI